MISYKLFTTSVDAVHSFLSDSEAMFEINNQIKAEGFLSAETEFLSRREAGWRLGMPNYMPKTNWKEYDIWAEACLSEYKRK